MKRLFLLLLCITLLSCAAAETILTFPHMHYGDEAFQLHMNNEVNTLIFRGKEYQLEDDRFSYHEAFPVYGGKTRAVYEMTLPGNRFSLQGDGEDPILGTVVIDIPAQATLIVGVGNRRSREYTLQEPITLTDVYREEITIPRGENGMPLLIDRVYLYSYEQGGQTIRRAATLFIDYEGYSAGYTDAAAAPAMSSTAAPTAAPTEAPTEQPTEAPIVSAVLMPSPITLALPAVLVLVVILVITARKKPQPKALPAAEAPAPDFADQAEGLMASIRQEIDQLADAELSARAESLLSICKRILRAAQEQPAKVPACRKFLSYYLPTTLKILSSCRSITQSGVSSAEADKARASALKGMDMITQACQTLLDSLFGGDVQDLTLDVEVLEKMLKKDGLIESELDISKLLPPEE